MYGVVFKHCVLYIGSRISMYMMFCSLYEESEMSVFPASTPRTNILPPKKMAFLKKKGSFLKARICQELLLIVRFRETKISSKFPQ